MNDIEKNTIHPSHYNKENRKECWDEIREIFGREIQFGFLVGSAYKYSYRAGEKEGNPKEQDIAKIREYLKKAREEKLTMFEEDMILIMEQILEKEGIEYGREE
jgi:hypothetical protein